MLRDRTLSGATGRLLRLLTAACPFLIVLLGAGRADAYTWMLRHGYSGCVTCHTDPSGGELLTPYGRAQGDLLLRMRYGKDTVSAQASDQSSPGESLSSFDSFDEGEQGGEQKEKAAEPAPAQPVEAEAG